MIECSSINTMARLYANAPDNANIDICDHDLCLLSNDKFDLHVPRQYRPICEALRCFMSTFVLIDDEHFPRRIEIAENRIVNTFMCWQGRDCPPGSLETIEVSAKRASASPCL